MEANELAKEVIKNFKINEKTLDEYFSDENTKKRLIGRINQAITFSDGGEWSKLDDASIIIGGLAPLIAAVCGGFTWVHEIGHHMAANCVYDMSELTYYIYVNGFEGAHWLFGPSPFPLTPFGESLGQEASRGFLLAGGVGLESICCWGLFGLGYALRKNPVGKALMTFSTTWNIIGPSQYAVRGALGLASETQHAALALGIPPALFATLIAAPIPVALGAIYLKHKLSERKKEKRNILKCLISERKISPDELLESFQNYSKSEKINSLEHELLRSVPEKKRDKIAGLLSSKTSLPVEVECLYREKKFMKKIRGVVKKLLKNYTKFTDSLVKEYKPRIKEHNKEEKERNEGYFNSDYLSFKEELCYFGVPEKKIKNLYDMLHKSSSYEDFCIKNKKYKMAEKFMKKAGLSPESISLNKVVSALGDFYEKGPLHLR